MRQPCHFRPLGTERGRRDILADLKSLCLEFQTTGGGQNRRHVDEKVLFILILSVRHRTRHGNVGLKETPLPHGHTTSYHDTQLSLRNSGNSGETILNSRIRSQLGMVSRISTRTDSMNERPTARNSRFHGRRSKTNIPKSESVLSEIRVVNRTSGSGLLQTLPVSTIPFSARQSPDYRVALHRIGSGRLEVSEWFDQGEPTVRTNAIVHVFIW